MSNRAMNWVWGLRLPPTPKLVMTAIADTADDDGVCWPSVPTLAYKCCISKRTVQRILKEVTTAKLLLTEPRYRKDGSRTSNRYRLALNGGDNLSGAPVTPVGTPGQGCQGPPDAHVIPGTTKRSLNELPPPQQQEPRPVAPAEPASTGCGGEHVSEFEYPRELSAAERAEAQKRLAGLDEALAQQLLDELAGRMEAGAVQVAPLAYLRGLIDRARRGAFTPEAALRVSDKRARRRRSEAILRQAESDPGFVRITDEPSDESSLARRLADIRSRSKRDREDGQ